jgi:hypothetical protein
MGCAAGEVVERGSTGYARTMSAEDLPPDPADDRPVEGDAQVSPPDRLDVSLEADEADVLEQSLEVPPSDDEL